MVDESFSFATFDFNGFAGQREDNVLLIKGSRPREHLFSFQEIAGHQGNIVFGFSNSHDALLAKQSLQEQQAFDDLINFNSISRPEINHGGLPGNGNLHAGSIDNKEASPMSRPFWDLLNNFGAGLKKLSMSNGGASGGNRKFSTEDIIRIAGARYIQFCDLSYDDFSMAMHPFGHALSGLSEEEIKDAELVHLLLAAAEKVAYEQYERACRLLSRCEWIASERSNPVRRVVYFFAEALRQRMDKETGEKNPAPSGKIKLPDGVDNEGPWTNPTFLMLYQVFPLLQTMNFAAVQTIVENVPSASKIHVIDFEIRSGVQWTIFMQAITERNRINPVEHLKITAVGIVGKNNLEEIGRNLTTMAESLKLQFSFRALYVEDMSEVREKMFEVAAGEAVVVYCSLFLRTMIVKPDRLEDVMRVIKRLKPAVMVVEEVEANLNSPAYVRRFIEALFFYSAFFDCLEACTGQESELRSRIESVLFLGIQNIVALEGEDRTARSVKMEVWRAFFARFGMVEIGVTESAFNQANLVIRQYPAAVDSCWLENNGKGVAVVWKGTPLYCLSAWKFRKERGRVFGTYTLDLNISEKQT